MTSAQDERRSTSTGASTRAQHGVRPGAPALIETDEQQTGSTPLSRDEVGRDRTAQLARNVTDAGSHFRTEDGDQSYADERRIRRRRVRLAWFAVSVPLWVLAVVPLARDSMDGRGGAELVLVYLAAGAVSLGAAALIRGVYVALMNRQLWSPWLFLIAALLAITTYGVQSAGDEEVPLASAPLGVSTQE